MEQGGDPNLHYVWSGCLKRTGSEGIWPSLDLSISIWTLGSLGLVEVVLGPVWLARFGGIGVAKIAIEDRWPFKRQGRVAASCEPDPGG